MNGRQSVLLVVAHPDDEVLGAGGTAAAFADAGHDVRACILSGSVEARQARPDLQALFEDMDKARRVLGLGPAILGDFPNIGFNAVAHLDLVEFIEEAIEQTEANIIFTHHPGDLNDDHLHTSRACQAAARLFQRRKGIKPLESLHFMEVPSSTDWAFSAQHGPFRPTTFVGLGDSLLQRKLEALRQYRGVMREFPHSRSEEVVRALAATRGAQAGTPYAEAFETVFQRLST